MTLTKQTWCGGSSDSHVTGPEVTFQKWRKNLIWCVFDTKGNFKHSCSSMSWMTRNLLWAYEKVQLKHKESKLLLNSQNCQVCWLDSFRPQIEWFPRASYNMFRKGRTATEKQNPQGSGKRSCSGPTEVDIFNFSWVHAGLNLMCVTCYKMLITEENQRHFTLSQAAIKQLLWARRLQLLTDSGLAR